MMDAFAASASAGAVARCCAGEDARHVAARAAT
jgi:hypothetical protein